MKLSETIPLIRGNTENGTVGSAHTHPTTRRSFTVDGATMKRAIFLSFATLILSAVAGSVSFSQDLNPPPDLTELTDAATPPPQAYIPHPPDLYQKFTRLKEGEAPLQLGDANDRVRELQASLNRELRNEDIKLGQSVRVGDALGPDSPEENVKNKVRIVLSEKRKKAFIVRGNWTPLEQPEIDGPKTKIAFLGEHKHELALAQWVRMPDEPIKVDGVYGQHTEAAVALFQWQHGLPVTGIVDVVTLDKLEPMVPTNPLLAVAMDWIGNAGMGPFKLDAADDNHPYWVKTCTSLMVSLIICLGAAVVFQIARTLADSTSFLTRWLFTPSSSPWFTAMRENMVFMRAAQFAPAVFIYLAALVIFPIPDENLDNLPYLNVFQSWRYYIANLGLAYLSLVLMLVLFAIANTFDAVFNSDQETENPIGSIVGAAKRVIGVIGTLMICASLTGRHPFYIIGGLGAFTAVFMLVFRDYLLGLVASIQIIANRVVKVGDWIAMPKFNADGDVQEMSLGLIKVRNFDKTVSSIPTSAVLTESFRNWTGMQISGGRRIKRSLLIDMRSIQVCTPEMIERFEPMELIHDYIREKREELAEYNRTHDVDASTVNSRRLTNIGTFRAYLKAYLGTHPGLNSEMTFLVRHLQPTSNGLPIEIYAFSKETNSAAYEAVQADIFDHVLAIVPEFGLKTFQEVSDAHSVEPNPFGSADLQTALTEVEQLIKNENIDLSEKPRQRLATSLRRVQQKIKDLALDERVEANGSGRVISLRHLQFC